MCADVDEYALAVALVIYAGRGRLQNQWIIDGLRRREQLVPVFYLPVPDYRHAEIGQQFEGSAFSERACALRR